MKYIENIAERVHYAEKRAAVIYAKPNGKLYKWVRILYYIFMYLSVLMSALYVAGRLSRIYELKKLALDTVNAADLEKAQQSTIYVGICAFLWVAATIVLRFKAEIISAVLTIIPSGVSLFVLVQASQNTPEFNEGINTAFWFRHFIPVILAVSFICWLAVIRIRAEVKFKTAYTNMINRIYEQYNSEDLTEEKWAAFLENYDPRAEEEKRRRAKKGENGYKNVITDEE